MMARMSTLEPKEIPSENRVHSTKLLANLSIDLTVGESFHGLEGEVGCSFAEVRWGKLGFSGEYQLGSLGVITSTISTGVSELGMVGVGRAMESGIEVFRVGLYLACSRGDWFCLSTEDGR